MSRTWFIEFRAIFIKIPTGFLRGRNWQKVNCIWKFKVKSFLRRKKIERPVSSNNKTYYKAAVLRQCAVGKGADKWIDKAEFWNWCKHIWALSIWTERALHSSEETMDFTINSVETTRYLHKKKCVKVGSSLTLVTKSNPRWIQDPNEKRKSMKF